MILIEWNILLYEFQISQSFMYFPVVGIFNSLKGAYCHLLEGLSLGRNNFSKAEFRSLHHFLFI